MGKRDTAEFYFIVGRIKDMFISGGENVYPAEIESMLAEVAEVSEVAVVGIADPRWDEVGCARIQKHLLREPGA